MSDADLLKLYEQFYGDSHLSACRALYDAGVAAATPLAEPEDPAAEDPAPEA